MAFIAILRSLAAAQVDFIVVGGVGALLQGAPIQTLDLDLVHSRAGDNRRRLASVLRDLDACYRELLPKRVAPRADDLASPDHHLLATRFCDLDLLGTIHGGLGYEELLPRSPRMTLDDDLVVRVLDLRGLIEVKEAAGRAKDVAQLTILRATLRERLERGDLQIPPPGREGT